MGRRRRLVIFTAVIVAIVIALILWIERPKPVAVTITTVETGEVERTVTNTRAGTL